MPTLSWKIRAIAQFRIGSWVLEFDFDREITEIWNGVIEEQERNHYVVRNATYNSTIVPGGSVSFGVKGGDGLSNLSEIQIGTSIFKADTDSDGVSDAKEIELGTDPLVYEDAFELTVKAEDADTVKVSVETVLSGEQVESRAVERFENEFLFPVDMPGYIGGAYDFSVDGSIGHAVIRFEFDQALLADPSFDPVIYYFNEQTQLLEELDTHVEGNVASTEVTHFSKYILLNRKVFESAFEWQDVWSTTGYSGVEVVLVIDDSFSIFGAADDNILRMMVVLTDGETFDTRMHPSVVSAANDKNVRIYTVGLGTGSSFYYNMFLKPLAENTAGTFYMADNAEELDNIYKNINKKIDIEMDSDGDGIPDYYEEHMVMFNGMNLVLDKNNPDSDGDGVPDGEEIEELDDVPKIAGLSHYLIKTGNSLNLKGTLNISSEVWEKGFSKRGFEIEDFVTNLFKRTDLGKNFPVADALCDRTLISTKSLDIAASSYQNPDKLKKRLDCSLASANVLASWEGIYGKAEFFEMKEADHGIFKFRAEMRSKDCHKISYFLQTAEDLLLECGMQVHQPNRRKKLDEKLAALFEEFALGCRFFL